MRRCVLLLALFGGAALAAEPKADVGKLMKAAHGGDKSPHARVTAELKKDAPEWAQLAKDAKAFTEMGAALKDARGYSYASPAKYVESAAALSKAAGDKDRPAAVAAFAALNKSCAACHIYGTPK
jgi:cytochrome c556